MVTNRISIKPPDQMARFLIEKYETLGHAFRLSRSHFTLISGHDFWYSQPEYAQEVADIIYSKGYCIAAFEGPDAKGFFVHAADDLLDWITHELTDDEAVAEDYPSCWESLEVVHG